ncbi:acyl-CoA synthetase [Spirillospora sp. NPDC047279]|uniref:acyl-CoA synthetase n=1 Tax=Spirillospora sp. NPDC047279 TaxID=3155478 RepID=UPI0033C03764
MEFNHADLFEGVADAIGDRVALICGDRRLTYAELDAEANRFAHHLLSVGVQPGQHVAVQLYNGIEYAVALLAALKIRAVPINVNYRYVESELLYIYKDSDSVALLYDAEFDERVAATVPQAPKLRHLISVGASGVPGAVTYEEALAAQPATRGFAARSADDTYIIYTGGTTGMPKGVMWGVKDMLLAFWNPTFPRPNVPQDVVDLAVGSGPLIMMPIAPLMHGAAQMATFISWNMGATVVYVRKFDAAGVWRTIEREKVNSLTITGDAMAIPMVEELEREASSYDLSSLFAYVSTGAILTGTVRDRLAAAMPNVMIMDRFGSTESGSTAEAVAGSTPEKGLRFAPDVENVTVLDDSLKVVEPGSGVIGQVARSGYIARGYYNDPEKTARTFPEADGRRWLLTGDIATVEADGSIAVYGRGSQAINTGGEKVFPEEVEAVLKGHPGVYDAVVTGIPDERWGSRVAAVVQPAGAEPPAQEDLDAHCRKELSGYKVPRTYAFVTEMKRSPAGKADYRWAKEVAEKA